MQYQYFKTIAGNSMYRYLLIDAACVGERVIDGLPALLFQNGELYVELVLNSMGTGVIAAREFTNVDELEPYLSQISISFFF